MSVSEEERDASTARGEDEAERLVREFETCTLPGERWTHEAHLTVALRYLTRHAEADAARRTSRSSITAASV
jgi:hypothetical protein